MHFKRYPWILILNLYFLLPNHLFSQKINSKTVLKVALESGHVDMHQQFGNGILYRGILRLQSKINFNNSNLVLKGRFSPEYYDVDSPIKSIGYQVNLTYLKLFSRNLLQLDGSINSQSSSIDTFGTQVFNEWQIGALFNCNISKTVGLELRDSYLSRRIEIDNNINFSKNRISFLISCKTSSNSIVNAGPFLENLYLSDPDTTDSKKLFGLQMGYQYNKFIILNVAYQFGFYANKDYENHQLNLFAGKYLSKKVSLFLSVLYTWINDDQEYLRLFSRVEAFNNVHLKLGYDFSDKLNIYLKGILEDHKLVNYKNLISSKQALLGIQYKF